MMSQTKPTYEELEQRCQTAEAMLAAFRSKQTDMDTGEHGILVQHLAETEESLRLNIERLRLALDAANAGTWEWDLQTNANVWSEELWKVYGLEPYSGTPSYELWKQTIHPADRENAEQAVQQAACDDTELHAEWRVRDPDGTERWLMSRGKPIHDANGNAIRFIGIVLDITERKRTEEAIKSARAFLEMIIDTSPIAMWISNKEGTIKRVNHSLCESINLTAQEIIDKYNVLRDNNLEIQGVMPNVRAVFEKHKPTRFCIPWKAADAGSADFKKASDMFIDVSMFPIVNAQGELENVVSQWIDVTEQKRIEDELHRLNIELERRVAERTAELSDLYNNAPCGYHSLNNEGVYVQINDTELGWLGYQREDLVGKVKFPDLLTPSSAHIFDLIFPIFIKQGMENDLEYDMVRKDGSILPVLLSATAITDDEGSFVMSRSTMIDYTERKRVDAELRQSQARLETANKELEAFAYSVSHDLRSPLRGIGGWSMALSEDYHGILDKEGQVYLERIRSETRRMGQLIDDLLQLSRVTRTEMLSKTVKISILVQSIIDRLRTLEPIRPMEVIVQPDLTVVGDPALLEIALTNLIENAWKFTSKVPQGCIEFGQREIDGKKVFFIRDNGAGFDMKYTQNLFGVFQRLHKESEFPGTGIGLAIVQRIIHRHGGRVWVDAQVDRGAIFYFTIEKVE